jgi:hypothetical protein
MSVSTLTPVFFVTVVISAAIVMRPFPISIVFAAIATIATSAVFSFFILVIL